MTYPKISIVTPNFNGERFLEETILSLLDQKYPNLEYIIIDGASTDKSVEIIKKYESFLHYWESSKDNGMYHAIQKGFEKSSGEIMAWLNSDDMYHNNSLFTIAEIFNSLPNVNWLQGLCTAFDELGRTVSCFPARGFSKYDFLNHDYKWIQQESVFWRRSLWEKAGARLNTDLKYAGDFDLWLRFFQYDFLYRTDALIGGFRFRSSGQITKELLNEYLSEVDKILSDFSLDQPDIKILKGYQRALRKDKILRLFKVFHRDIFAYRFRKKYFPKPVKAIFDRNEMVFKLSDF
jgi:glycosyltransferase involved in cell wall biosynthesis